MHVDADGVDQDNPSPSKAAAGPKKEDPPLTSSDKDSQLPDTNRGLLRTDSNIEFEPVE